MGRIFFYGERGIVNGLVLDTKDNLALMKSVLRAVEWCSPADRTWIDTVEDVTYLVEPRFGDFGQPDLVLVFHLPGGGRRWLFLEGKVVPYSASAKSNTKGMLFPSYNSSINGQLSLDFRLVQAMDRYQGGPEISESAETFRHYEAKLNDPNGAPRKAPKPQMMMTVFHPYCKGITLADSVFVVMSRDIRPNPINQALLDHRPVLLSQEGEDAWVGLASRFGFLSLEELDTAILNRDGYFRDACRMHIGKWSRNMRKEGFDGEWFTWANLNEFPGLKQPLDALVERIEERTHSWVTLTKHQGSYSFSCNDKVLAKVAPRNPAAPETWCGFSIVVASAEDFAKRIGTPQRFLLGPSKEPFLMVAFDPTRQAEEVCETVVAFLEDGREAVA